MSTAPVPIFREASHNGREPEYVPLWDSQTFPLDKIACTRSTVLMLGETGTGKEIAAKAIHDNSPRSRYPFIAVNCGALPAELIESELFGHLRGTFTGAVADKTGKFEAANGGTIFLDEIGELPLAQQVKLLRVLQERQITRLGSNRDMPLDIRIIAATNQNLAKAVQDGKFREDLYHRLNVVPVTLPPLRKIKHEIPRLADFFLPRIADETFEKSAQIEVPPLSAAASDKLQTHDYPGNIRELRNVLERALVESQGNPEIEPEHVFFHNSDVQPAESLSNTFGRTLPEKVDEYKKGLIQEALKRCQGHYGKAARDLGIPRTSLNTMCKILGIEL